MARRSGGTQRRVLEPQTILHTIPRILLLPPCSTPYPRLWATAGWGKVQESD